ncbi:hypothetical protein LDENG_00106420 [Lucifuga dentata]|nr:hypothetical protein LDENG_00106420 [Lucifuga dentata]
MPLWLCTAAPPPQRRKSPPRPAGTMQSAEATFNRNSLPLALRRYSSAVSNMEQTVLLPSLLRDVPSDEVWDCEAAETCGDLYDKYLTLKAIRNTVESGLVALDDHKAKTNMALNKSLEPLLDTDPEALFHFHLEGLFSVMSDLIKETLSVTDKYMDIIRAAN